MPSPATTKRRLKTLRLQKIVSGGQTGVDRAALDAAIDAGMVHGGWCPRGRLAEDGPIPTRYQLSETDGPDYRFRTECNVVDSNGTLILYDRHISGGTLLTYRFAEKYNRPCYRVDLAQRVSIPLILGWLKEYRIETLNVAGPRESTQPGIYHRSLLLLKRLLSALPQGKQAKRAAVDGRARR